MNAEETIRSMKAAQLKNAEKKIVGELLVEFFEAERNLNALIAADVDPTRSDLIDDFLVHMPLRVRIDRAKRAKLLNAEESKLFHRLCDGRNRLAHGPQNRQTRIAHIFPPASQEKFLQYCEQLNASMLKRINEAINDYFNDGREEQA